MIPKYFITNVQGKRKKIVATWRDFAEMLFSEKTQ